jgi:hypothetical protein
MVEYGIEDGGGVGDFFAIRIAAQQEAEKLIVLGRILLPDEIEEASGSGEALENSVRIGLVGIGSRGGSGRGNQMPRMLARLMELALQI